MDELPENNVSSMSSQIDSFVVKKIRRIANPKPEVVIQVSSEFADAWFLHPMPNLAKLAILHFPKKAKVDERFACIPTEQRENTSLRKAYGQN